MKEVFLFGIVEGIVFLVPLVSFLVGIGVWKGTIERRLSFLEDIVGELREDNSKQVQLLERLNTQMEMVLEKKLK